MKKTLASVLSVIALLTFFSCGNKQEAEGKVFNVYIWNNEFKELFYDYFATKVPADVKVNFIETPKINNAYEKNLEEMLKNQEKLPKDERIDVFLVEADYGLKYVESPYTLDVKGELGLTEEELSQQYKYTKDMVTDSNGALKAVSWQCCPGGFIYRRSVAKEVFGNDNPEDIQRRISDWSGFDKVASQMKESGFYMLYGYEDFYRVFADNAVSKWVTDSKITVDPVINLWIEQTKKYSDKGYNAADNDKVFGYFAPAWFIDSLNPREEGSSFGDWAFCKGPQSFSWGGTWICGAAGSDNLSIIKDLMLTFTCNKSVITKIAKDRFDFTNNEAAMRELAQSDYKNAFLGGQNNIALFIDSVSSIDRSYVSAYDQGMAAAIQASMRDYFEDKVDLDTAWDNFYNTVLEKYPELSK